MTKTIVLRHASLLFCIAALLLPACSTRQVADNFEGSTEQRLVTRSIDRLMNEMPANPIQKVEGSRIYYQTHFIRDNAVVDYATARLKAEINRRHNVKWVESMEEADYHLDVYFTSLGTDEDSLGFSVPIPVQNLSTGSLATIEILSIQMYHGISGMYFYLTEMKSSSVDFQPYQRAEVQTDTLATPIITLPIHTVDCQWVLLRRC